MTDKTNKESDELTRSNQYDFPYILAFVNLVQIESYLRMWGILGDSLVGLP